MHVDHTPEQKALRDELRAYFEGLITEELLAELDEVEGGGPLYHEAMQQLEAAYEEFAELTGRDYGLVSQYRNDDAEVTFVSFGSAAENIEAAVDFLREQDGAKVGSVHINVVRPLPEAAIVKALAGKSKIIVLERADDGLSGDNQITREIRAVMSKAYEIHSLG